MSEAEGYGIPSSMAWVGGETGCPHLLEYREVTVEGGVGCAVCGALLLPRELADSQAQTASETQVRYKLEGRAAGVTLSGEWEDLEVAFHCANRISELGGYAAVFKVTKERVQ